LASRKSQNAATSTINDRRRNYLLQLLSERKISDLVKEMILLIPNLNRCARSGNGSNFTHSLSTGSIWKKKKASLTEYGYWCSKVSCKLLCRGLHGTEGTR
jgi:hypothetical protein